MSALASGLANWAISSRRTLVGTFLRMAAAATATPLPYILTGLLANFTALKLEESQENTWKDRSSRHCEHGRDR